MVVFTNSSFYNKVGLTTQLGSVILLSDGSGRANVLDLSSYKSKRRVLSLLGGDTYAFEDGFSATFMLGYGLEVGRDSTNAYYDEYYEGFRFTL